MGTNKEIIAKRQIKQDKITELISQGYKPKEIMQTLNISRNQYYRDLNEIKKDLLDPKQIRENVVRLYLQREYIIQKTMEDYLNSNEAPARAVFSKILRDLINDKEKSFERLGLLNMNEIFKEDGVKELIKKAIERMKCYSESKDNLVLKETIKNIDPINKNKITDLDIDISMYKTVTNKKEEE